MKSPNDRPIQSEVNLWLGPDYTPYSLKCKSENGNEYPIQTLIGTKGYAVNVELKNTGAYNFPINTAASYAIGDLEESVAGIVTENQGNTYIDGGAIRMYPFRLVLYCTCLLLLMVLYCVIIIDILLLEIKVSVIIWFIRFWKSVIGIFYN